MRQWKGWRKSRAHRYKDIEINSRAHFPTFLSLHLRHSPFCNPSVALSTSQLILQPFCCFTYVRAHSPTLLLLYLHRSSFSKLFVALPTSQLILQPFSRFTYVTAHSLTILSLLLRHSLLCHLASAHEFANVL